MQPVELLESQWLEHPLSDGVTFHELLYNDSCSLALVCVHKEVLAELFLVLGRSNPVLDERGGSLTVFVVLLEVKTDTSGDPPPLNLDGGLSYGYIGCLACQYLLHLVG